MSKTYYRGQELFLYVQFKDEKGNPIDVINPTVRVDYEKDGEFYSLFKDGNDYKDLIQLSSTEYYLTITIPESAEYSMYDIEYSATDAIDENKVARLFENFHIIPRSEDHSNAIKLYGFIHQAMLGYPLISASVKISLTDSSKVISKSYTKLDGKWEAYLYPGEYDFEFSKFGFKSEIIRAQIGAEHSEIQFDNVALKSNDFLNKGNGVYNIKDKYVTREGVPLNGLAIKAYNILNLNIVSAEDITNDDGEYNIFLDPGVYLLKVNGVALMENFEQTFRLRIEEDGSYTFDNLTQNVVAPIEEEYVGRGNEQSLTSILVEDYIKDSNGNAIVDVQVCVYSKNNINQLVAQDYTNPAGKWTVYLEPGTYVFEFYHPEFHEFQEERVIK